MLSTAALVVTACCTSTTVVTTSGGWSKQHLRLFAELRCVTALVALK